MPKNEPTRKSIAQSNYDHRHKILELDPDAEFPPELHPSAEKYVDYESESAELSETYLLNKPSELSVILGSLRYDGFAPTHLEDGDYRLSRPFASEVASELTTMMAKASQLLRWNEDGFEGIVDIVILDLFGPALVEPVSTALTSLAQAGRKRPIDPDDNRVLDVVTRPLVRHFLESRPVAPFNEVETFVCDALKYTWPASRASTQRAAWRAWVKLRA